MTELHRVYFMIKLQTMAAYNSTYDLDLSQFRANDTDTVNFDGAPFIQYNGAKFFYRFYIPSVLRPSSFEAHYMKHPYLSVCSPVINFLYLNPGASINDIKQFAKIVNSKAVNRMTSKQMDELIEDVLYIRESDQIEEMATPNLRRNFVLNPGLSESKKIKFRNQCIGVVRSAATLSELEELLGKWRKEWGKPTNQNIANRSDFEFKTVEKYSPQLKEAKKKALRVFTTPKPNITLESLRQAMLGHDLKNGLPTYKDLTDATGKSLDTVKKYGKYLKPIKAHLKKKLKNSQKEFDFFAPFDGTLEDITKEIQVKEPVFRDTIDVRLLTERPTVSYNKCYREQMSKIEELKLKAA